MNESTNRIEAEAIVRSITKQLESVSGMAAILIEERPAKASYEWLRNDGSGRVRTPFTIVLHGIPIVCVCILDQIDDEPPCWSFTFRTEAYGFQVWPQNLSDAYWCNSGDESELGEDFSNVAVFNSGVAQSMAKTTAARLHDWFDGCCRMNNYINPYRGYLSK